MLASALYQTIDGVFVGRFLGETAFAALNLAMPFVIINFSLADLIGVGSAVPISVCLGKNQHEEANSIFTCACLMIVAAGVVIGAAMFLAAPFLIRFMGAEGKFAGQAVQYLRVYAVCSPVTTIVFARGQLSAHLRLYPGQYVHEYSDVPSVRTAGNSFSGRIWMGRVGSGACRMYRHVYLRADCSYPVFPRKSAAALLPSPFSPADVPPDTELRQPQFS